MVMKKNQKMMRIKMKKKRSTMKMKKSLPQFAKLMVFLKREKVLMERNLNSIADQSIVYNINLT
jgi:hypothetical protein